MTVSVHLFGPIASAAGTPLCTIALETDRSPAAVLRRLGEICPAIQPLLPGCRLAVNSRFASPDTVISNQDELAVIGLVSGG